MDSTPGPSKVSGKQIIHSQSREIVYNVYKFMQKEATEGVQHVKHVVERVSLATGVSKSTIRRIVGEGSKQTSFSSPKKTPKKATKSVLNEEEQQCVRNIIYTFHNVHNVLPTMEAVYKVVREDEDINFTGGLSSFRRLIKRLGFKWCKGTDNRKILIERYNIRLLR